MEQCGCARLSAAGLPCTVLCWEKPSLLAACSLGLTRLAMGDAALLCYSATGAVDLGLVVVLLSGRVRPASGGFQQFQETVKDYLENWHLLVLTPLARKRLEGLFTRLVGLRREIDEFQRRLLTSEAWLAYQGYLTCDQVAIWKAEKAKNHEGLKEAKYKFWTLNCPSPVDHAKLQALEETQFNTDREFWAAKARVWKELCEGEEIEQKPASYGIVFTRPISERLQFEPKPSEKEPKDKTVTSVVALLLQRKLRWQSSTKVDVGFRSQLRVTLRFLHQHVLLELPPVEAIPSRALCGLAWLTSSSERRGLISCQERAWRGVAVRGWFYFSLAGKEIKPFRDSRQVLNA
eukprot:1009935-Rhodomonas_salina.2